MKSSKSSKKKNSNSPSPPKRNTAQDQARSQSMMNQQNDQLQSNQDQRVQSTGMVNRNQQNINDGAESQNRKTPTALSQFGKSNIEPSLTEQQQDQIVSHQQQQQQQIVEPAKNQHQKSLDEIKETYSQLESVENEDHLQDRFTQVGKLMIGKLTPQQKLQFVNQLMEHAVQDISENEQSGNKAQEWQMLAQLHKTVGQLHSTYMDKDQEREKTLENLKQSIEEARLNETVMLQALGSAPSYSQRENDFKEIENQIKESTEQAISILEHQIKIVNNAVDTRMKDFHKNVVTLVKKETKGFQKIDLPVLCNNQQTAFETENQKLREQRFKVLHSDSVSSLTSIDGAQIQGKDFEEAKKHETITEVDEQAEIDANQAISLETKVGFTIQFVTPIRDDMICVGGESSKLVFLFTKNLKVVKEMSVIDKTFCASGSGASGKILLVGFTSLMKVIVIDLYKFQVIKEIATDSVPFDLVFFDQNQCLVGTRNSICLIDVKNDFSLTVLHKKSGSWFNSMLLLKDQANPNKRVGFAVRDKNIGWQSFVHEPRSKKNPFQIGSTTPRNEQNVTVGYSWIHFQDKNEIIGYVKGKQFYSWDSTGSNKNPVPVSIRGLQKDNEMINCVCFHPEFDFKLHPFVIVRNQMEEVFLRKVAGIKSQKEESLPIDMYDAARRYFLVQTTASGDIIAFDGLGYGKVRRYEWTADQISKCQSHKSLFQGNINPDDSDAHSDIKSQKSLVMGSIIAEDNQDRKSILNQSAQNAQSN